MSLRFDELRTANANRGVEWCGKKTGIEDMEFCAIELGGESGEALDAVKKYLRFLNGWKGGVEQEQAVDAIAKELADVVICADRLAESLGIDLGEAVKRKFNITSDRYNLSVKL